MEASNDSVEKFHTSPFLTRMFTPPMETSRPLQMVVLGDSVAWGQGVREEEGETLRFATQVADWVSSRTGAGVELRVYAHSGAMLLPEDVEGPTTDAQSGEIPRDYPSIAEQIERIVKPAEIDLVLVSGGINNFYALSIADPTVEANWITERARHVFEEAMPDILTKLAERCSRAQILVIGYWQPVSGATVLPSEEIVEVVDAWCRDKTLIGPLQLGDWCRDLAGEVRSHTGKLKEILVSNSAAWKTASDDWLTSSIATAMERTASRFTGAMHFVPLDWGEEHAWGTPEPFVFSLTEKDPMFDERGAQCREQVRSDWERTGWKEISERFRKNPREMIAAFILQHLNPFCTRAAAFHPNEKGHAAIRDAVVENLEKSGMVERLQR